jgi:hypothetical protein
MKDFEMDLFKIFLNFCIFTYIYIYMYDMKFLAGEHNFIMSCSLRKILGLFVTNVELVSESFVRMFGFLSNFSSLYHRFSWLNFPK